MESVLNAQGKSVGFSKVIITMFLVAGTCIGSGMLALPVGTAAAGFYPSLAFIAVCGIFMALTGICYVEATLWMGRETHYITMSSRLLGPFGKFVVILCFLMISYSSLIAYVAEGGALFALAFRLWFGLQLGKWVSCILFIVVFGLIVEFGAKLVGRINALLFIAMGVAYVLLIVSGMEEIQAVNLSRQGWGQGCLALPLLLTIFSYQTVVPSLVEYMEGNGHLVRRAIWGGVFLAFVIYVLYQMVIQGVVPAIGEYSLSTSFIAGETATEAFRYHVQSKWVSGFSEFFSFFAIVTSFLGITLGTYDFVDDGLHLRHRRFGPLLITLIVLVPALICAASIPGIFLLGLEFTGGFGDGIFSGLIPPLMIWIGRYIKGYSHSFRIRGGKVLLVCLIAFSLFVIAMEIVQRIAIWVPFQDLR